MPPARITRLPLPTPYPVGPVNAYWLAGPQPLLVDPGVHSPESRAALVAGLAAHGLRLEDARGILVTHGHYDHAGAALALSHELRVPVALARRSTLTEPRTGEAVDRLLAFLGRCGVPQPTLQAAETLFRRGPRPVDLTTPPHEVRRLSDGDALPFLDGQLRVVATPGHSPDHLCFVDEATGALLSGDMLLPRITPNPLLYLDPADGGRRHPSLLHYLDSLAALERLPLTVGHPGHGETIDDVPALIAANRAFIQRRRDDLAARLAPEPATPFELALAVFGRTDPMSVFLALSEVVAYLDPLEQDGLAAVEWEGAIRVRKR